MFFINDNTTFKQFFRIRRTAHDCGNYGYYGGNTFPLIGKNLKWMRAKKKKKKKKFFFLGEVVFSSKELMVLQISYMAKVYIESANNNGCNNENNNNNNNNSCKKKNNNNNNSN